MDVDRLEDFSALLHRLAISWPRRIAFRSDEAELSYGAFDEQASRCANLLREYGVQPGDRVAILCTNHLEYLVAAWGAWRAGCIVVPLNFRLTAHEVGVQLRDSAATALVVDAGLRHLVDEREHLRLVAVLGERIEHDDVDFVAALASASADYAPVPVGCDEVCLIIYTSGTTGTPKGAMLTYRNLLAQSTAMTAIFRLALWDEVHQCSVPLFHIAGIGSLIPFMMAGGCSVIDSSGGFEPRAFLDRVVAHGITDVFLVPAQWQVVCALDGIDRYRHKLRRIAWGASPISLATLRAMRETFPGVDIVSAFGQTEMSPITCALVGSDSEERIGSVGRPIPYIQARVVDAEFNDVPQGAVGEIVYRGPTTFAGYWHRPAATAEAFTGGWFHSGDLVRQDPDGFVYVVDRIKDMIVSGGENVYSAEVEAALVEHPQVREVAVVGEPHEKWGEVPIAYVVAVDADAPPSAEVLREHCARRLARYKQPARYELIAALPRNAGGKVVKGRLSQA